MIAYFILIFLVIINSSIPLSLSLSPQIMMAVSCFSSLCMISLVLLVICKGTYGATFTLINRCTYTVWPGILSNAGSPRLDSTGFELQPGGSRSLQAQPGWSGRFWGRTGCTFDSSSGQGSCITGDCGSSKLECNGNGADPPATLAEFTIGSGNMDFYDVSLVDGYNLPMVVEASGGSGACGTTGCVTDLNRQCPNELRVVSGEACKSACEAFGSPEYCCSGAYGSPSTCKPSVYSKIFKTSCPRSYSYAYDDATSTFTCSGANYTITFCSSLTSKKSAGNSAPVTRGMPVESGSGSGQEEEDPTVFNSSWFTNDFSGGGNSTSTTLSSFAFLSSFIASIISLLIL